LLIEDNKTAKYKVGDFATMKKTVTREDVEIYAKISGDYNPVHLDEEYASNSIFGGCIAHALFCLGMISKIVGMELPGEGTIFLNENINYKAPAYIGDEIEAKVQILEIIREKSLMTLGLECRNKSGKLLLEGSTLVKII